VYLCPACVAGCHERDLVLAAEELRAATRELSAVVGTIEVEHLLDVIFRDFCIGK
jgi:tRNA modification GTPase